MLVFDKERVMQYFKNHTVELIIHNNTLEDVEKLCNQLEGLEAELVLLRHDDLTDENIYVYCVAHNNIDYLIPMNKKDIFLKEK